MIHRATTVGAIDIDAHRYQHGSSSYLAATVDMDEVDNLTSGSTLSLRLHARSVQV